jgi:streptogramin lyase
LSVGDDGLVQVAAGTGEPGFYGDGGLAVEAKLSEAAGVSVDDGGGFLIADTDNHCLRRVGPDGVIDTLSGGGAGFVDADVQMGAQFYKPQRVRWTPFGVYVADSYNHAVRRIDLDTGAVSTVAGNGYAGYGGDGGPANAASLNMPYGLNVDAEGAVWVADSGNHAVRRIDPDGTIDTVVGGLPQGFSGDGGDPLDAALAFPTDAFPAPDGFLYIADMKNGAVRRLRLE